MSGGPQDSIIIFVVAIIAIFILGAIGGALIQSTDDPEIKEKIEEQTERSMDIIVWIVAVLSTVGGLSLLALFLKGR